MGYGWCVCSVSIVHRVMSLCLLHIPVLKGIQGMLYEMAAPTHSAIIPRYKMVVPTPCALEGHYIETFAGCDLCIVLPRVILYKMAVPTPYALEGHFIQKFAGCDLCFVLPRVIFYKMVVPTPYALEGHFIESHAEVGGYGSRRCGPSMLIACILERISARAERLAATGKPSQLQGPIGEPHMEQLRASTLLDHISIY